jgi:two-component system LytT family sensor kinase
MDIPEYKYLNRTFFKINLQYGLVGLLVGLIVSALKSALNDRIISESDIFANLVFSTLITLSITNSVYLTFCLLRAGKSAVWQFIVVYYGCNIAGMIVGIELSYFIMTIVFHVPFHFLRHFSDYRFSFIIVVIASTVVYFYRARQADMNSKLKEKELDLVKVKQLITQAELQTLQSKINPHFLYNSLNSIASLIHQDADKAEDMTLKLSRLFRYSINSAQNNMALVTEEIEIVNTYLAIEKVRFGDRLHFTIQVDDAIKSNQVPRFLIQPLVENALKHGLNDLAANGELKINLTKDKENIVIIIGDNGKPFPTELDMGYGLQSTYDKLALLYADNYQVQITNSPEKQVKIIIPVSS